MAFFSPRSSSLWGSGGVGGERVFSRPRSPPETPRPLIELPCRLNFFKMTGQRGGNNWVAVVSRDVVHQLHFKNEQGTRVVLSLSPVTFQEGFAKVNSAQFPSRF